MPQRMNDLPSSYYNVYVPICFHVCMWPRVIACVHVAPGHRMLPDPRARLPAGLITRVVQVREADLGGVLDGESDVFGSSSSWALHVRDRLPTDMLLWLPAALRQLGRGRCAEGRRRRRGGGVWGGVGG